jgi:hypothetical protein
MITYLASPIDQGSLADLKARARDLLLARGCAIYDPSRAWTVGSASPSSGLQAINMAALDRCDGVLAILSPNVMSVGVVAELIHASTHDIPLALWGLDLKPSWSLAYYGIVPHTTLDNAVDSLLEEVGNV